MGSSILLMNGEAAIVFKEIKGKHDENADIGKALMNTEMRIIILG